MCPSVLCTQGVRRAVPRQLFGRRLLGDSALRADRHHCTLPVRHDRLLRCLNELRRGAVRATDDIANRPAHRCVWNAIRRTHDQPRHGIERLLDGRTAILRARFPDQERAVEQLLATLQLARAIEPHVLVSGRRLRFFRQTDPPVARFCANPRLACACRIEHRQAYALSGEGPPLVRAGTWLTHVHHDWESPIWAHWLRFMSERHTLVRYDPRGCGLSQTDVGEITLEDWVADLEAVVDRLELESFPLFGMSQGAAVAAEYAIRHPERVSHLTLYAPLVTGWRRTLTGPYSQAWRSMQDLVLAGWGEENMAFPAMFAHLFLPESTPEMRQCYAELQRKSASKEVASRFMSLLGDLSVFKRLKLIRVPTLVIQIAREQVIDPRTAAGVASEIAGSEFVSIDSRNHILLEDEPGWQEFKSVFTRHVPGATAPPRRDAAARERIAQLSQREQRILGEIAKGLNNREIASGLFISEKTVRNHITSIFDKLGVSSRAQAIVMAKEAGL
jgi:pimeloyl-ACP methyl ester carboxylesterase/DNA-binding CsgD family transcriptional regulator